MSEKNKTTMDEVTEMALDTGALVTAGQLQRPVLSAAEKAAAMVFPENHKQMMATPMGRAFVGFCFSVAMLENAKRAQQAKALRENGAPEKAPYYMPVPRPEVVENAMRLTARYNLFKATDAVGEQLGDLMATMAGEMGDLVQMAVALNMAEPLAPERQISEKAPSWAAEKEGEKKGERKGEKVQ